MTSERSIKYDRISHDYRAELDGNVIGFFKTHAAATVALDAHAATVAHDLAATLADEAAERPAIIVAERDRCIVVEADGREWVYALEVDGACRAAQRIAALEQAGYRLEAA